MTPIHQAAVLLSLAVPSAAGQLYCEPPPGARYHFEGVIGERIEANLHSWLLAMPAANPGLIEMFRNRDRQPKPDLLPWSGEFVGKYLTSAVQAHRMVKSPELERTIRQVIGDLASCQAEDGYLGPFPKAERLLSHWDLWGHYHIITALLDWHADTGDKVALKVARKMGDAVCATFLDTGKRVFQTGSTEMNMAILTGLVRLHRETGEERYLRMAREVEKDWEQAGDYFRQGLANKPFFRTPRPRWESLHDLQGLVELYRVTGDARYRTAFENLWRSIRNLDRHNTGGFSTGEQAVGDPYAQGAIETCCTVAWMAITADMLHLTGDSNVADELERSTYNGGLGAQHPSGRWWTYNTPMDGIRRASAHDIVFQARPGTPELNCCSVNAPRVLGVLSEWAVLRDAEGLLVSFYGPGRSEVDLADGVKVVLRQETSYPVEGRVALSVSPGRPRKFALRLRIPAWSEQTTAKLNGTALEGVKPGTWLRISRRWKAGDRVELRFDMRLRVEPGDSACAGKVSLFRGPLLLAWDQRLNAFDEHDLPTLDLANLNPVEKPVGELRPRPWLLLEVGPADRRMTLCDYATAGASGNPYRSWLPATGTGPSPFYLCEPVPHAKLPPGKVLLQWMPPSVPRPVTMAQTLTISHEPSGPPVHTSKPELPFEVVELPVGTYHWQVVRSNSSGQRANEEGWGVFTVEEGVPPQAAEAPKPLRLREDQAMVDAPLKGDAAPSFGELAQATGIVAAEDRKGDPRGAVAFNGKDSKLVYRFGYWPAGDYSVVAWFWLDAFPEGRIAQIMSAWCGNWDDPLRITIDQGEVFARIEGGGCPSTPGAPVELGHWYHVAAVREGGKLSLYLDGKVVGECVGAPSGPYSATTAVGVGCNPLYGGNEGLPGRVAGFRLYARALSGEEIKRFATE